ncbi:hypothetical protein CY34DRAFT_18531 [Suillus luteus UH-Slu-Lm8-n1]|uniref:Uncharacterized protein n=1 Tax=Suillus luteus UH-Slu-Lm8-n1 TaxID=930992 RepID=A0A0D0AG26_9AGAM|nr:hypothetical protein CY34DRAFT_18531 [Suillus luteus UH-Slu-Lm8-n1]
MTSTRRGRECLDIAETGSCSTIGRKLLYVIRANCKRKLPAPTASSTSGIAATASFNVISGCDTSSDNVLSSQHVDDAIQHLKAAENPSMWTNSATTIRRWYNKFAKSQPIMMYHHPSQVRADDHEALVGVRSALGRE